jgi:Contractile injection system tape measure protein
MTAPPTADSGEAEAPPISVANAGLVLLNPFLPRFFERLGVLSAGGATLKEGPDAAAKPVHLLQWVVEGRLDRPGAELTLNKLLCGLDPATPIAPHFEASPDDIAVCEQLVAAIIANWPKLGPVSAAGLRGNFLQREGTLHQEGADWSLTVRRKLFDVLMDQIPWSFATLHHRWMRAPIRVSW